MDGFTVVERPEDDDEPAGAPSAPEVSILDPEPHYAGFGNKSLARRAWEARHPDQFVKPGSPPGLKHGKSGAKGPKATPGPAPKPAPEIAIFGSPKGKGGAKSAPKVKSAPWVANALQAAHLMIAAKIGKPEFSIDAEEAGLLADAIAGLLDHYKIEVLSKEAGPWANLAGVVAMVYGPRVAMLIMTEMSKPRAAAAPAGGGAADPTGSDASLYDPTMYASGAS